MIETSVYNLIIDRLISHITLKLITEPSTLKLDMVREGKLQEAQSPQNTGLLVAIRSAGNTEKNTLSDEQDEGGRISAPPYQFQGGISYFTHFVAECSFQFRNATRDAARISSNVLLSRLKYAILNLPLEGLEDTFYERANFVELDSQYLEASGGEKTWTYKGQIDLRVLTTFQPPD